jgi:hemerythrin-like domain-containing protein
MARTDRFREQHNDMLKLIEELVPLLNENNLAKDATAARKGLNILMGKLKLHLSAEDNVFYPELVKSKDTELASLAVRFASEMKTTSKAVLDYNEKWSTPTSIKTNPSDFIKETKQIVAALRDRIKRENQQLYAAVDKTDGKIFQ